MTSSSNNGSIMDWQSGIGTIQDGVSHLWETGEHSDVEFMVGKELWDDKSKKWIPVEEPKVLVAHCLQFFDMNIKYVCIKNDDVAFWSLNREELGELLKRYTLQIYWESNLFYLLQFWAMKQCKNAGIEKPTGQEIRAKIGHLINEIRFPLIKHADFIKLIIPTGILTAEEISTMLIHYFEDADPLPFSTKSREILLYQGGYNKLVDKDMVEREKADLRGEIRRLKIGKSESENEKTEIEEKFKQLEKKSKEMEETIQRLEKNAPKSNTNLQAGGKRKKGM